MVASAQIRNTPVCVIDFETTGLSAGRDRVVEVSVVRVDPGEEPKLVLDTLVNPQRSVKATDVHGITDEDVADAPLFADIADQIIEAISGSVVAAYNVYFDMRFFRDEMARAGYPVEVPHVCLMYMRPLLGLGGRCPLGQACSQHSIPYEPKHHAYIDAYAAGRLVPLYLEEAQRNGISTYADLMSRGSYKFLKSLELPLLSTDGGRRREDGAPKIVSRAAAFGFGSAVKPAAAVRTSEREVTCAKLHTYQSAILSAVADRVIEEEEIREVAKLQRGLGLEKGQLRAVHASVFSAVLADAIEDRYLDKQEVEDLRKLHACLSELGYAPGC